MAKTNEMSVVVQTEQGSHGCFYEGANAESWSNRVAMEWIEALHAAEHAPASAQAQARVTSQAGAAARD